MAKPPIKRRPLTSDKKPPIPNREALLKTHAIRQTQVPVQDSDTNGPPPNEARRRLARDNGTYRTPVDPAAQAGDQPAEYDATGADDLQRISDPQYVGTRPIPAPAGFEETKTEDERHEQRLDWFYGEASRQAPNRREMAIDEAYYDSKQWNKEDEALVVARGQKPVTYNECKPVVDFMIGTETRSRVDFYVVAEDDDEGATDDAIAKTKLMKYYEDVNRAPFERSTTAKDSFKAGLGVLEVGLRGDKSGVPIYIGNVSWRDYLHDSRAKMDQSDARYNFRIKEVDLDVAIALFPDKRSELELDSTDGDSRDAFRGMHGFSKLSGMDTFGSNNLDDGNVLGMADVFNSRPRVTIIECWSREPVRKQNAVAGLGDPIEFKIRVSLMTESTTLLETWSPFKHDRFPFILYWCYRDSATGLPYGMIRSLRGPQDGLNRRMTRSVFEASFNQVAIEAGAIQRDMMDEDQLLAEMNDPTGVMIFAPGALSGNRVKFRENPGAGRDQISLAEMDRQTLRAISGVNEENRGLNSQATSRVAMDAKAERGSVSVSEPFDNQLLARQWEGEMVLSLSEQFVVQPMTIRVAGEQGSNKFDRVKINQPMPDGTYLNDITKRRAHFVVGESAYKQSYAESAFATLMDMLTQLSSSAPQVVIGLLDVVFDMHPNLPRKKTVLERIRAINGQTDPDGKATPEQLQAQQKKAQMAEMQFQLQMSQLQAEVMKAKAQGTKLDVDAMVARITGLYEAAQTAQVLLMAPGATVIADQVLASAGFKDQAGDPTVLPAAAAQPPIAPPQAGQDPRQGALMASGGDPMPPSPAVGAATGIETARPDGAPRQMPPEVGVTR